MIYAISDIHRYYDKYRAMLSEIQFKSTDSLYVLGDVIDRGPDGVKILQDMSVRPNVFPILGNHEFTAAVCLPWLTQEITEQSLDSLADDQIAALGDWINNGGEPTLQGLWKLAPEERQDILEYFQEMGLYAEVEAGGRSFVLTHAALENFDPEKPLEEFYV